MTESNTFNFENYTQNKVIDFGSNQVLTPIQTGTEIVQDNNQIDPSTYLQGDSAILQASAGIGETTTENVDYLNQNNFDTNAIFGETIKRINEIPYGQNFQGTTTTTTTTSNIIDGNTLFGDNNGIITNTTTTNEVQGTTVDPNSYFTNTNFDTNAIYGQTQILPETTTTTTTTTTNENTYFSQPQEIQGTTTYGETQILPSTDSNTYFSTTQVNYDQPQTQNDFTTYQTSGNIDLNNYNFSTNNIESGTTQTQQIYSTEVSPITQNETKTTTTTKNTYVEPTQYDTSNNYQNYDLTNTQTYQTSDVPVTTTTTTTTTQNTFESNAMPLTETQYIPAQPQYDLTQIMQNYDTTPTPINTDATNVTTTQTTTTTTTNINNPIVETTNYSPNQNQTQIITQPEIKNIEIINNTTNKVVIPENINNTNINNIDINQTPRETNTSQRQTVESKPQIIPINLNKNKGPSAYKILGNIIDEDFRRGRPIYTEYGSTYAKLRHYDQVAPTYQVKRIMNENRNVIGLSRLTPSMSYDRVGNNPPTLNSTLLKINTIPINPYYSNIYNIRQNKNLVNNNIGLERINKANSYDAGSQAINPLLNNLGFNQN